MVVRATVRCSAPKSKNHRNCNGGAPSDRPPPVCLQRKHADTSGRRERKRKREREKEREREKKKKHKKHKKKNTKKTKQKKTQRGGDLEENAVHDVRVDDVERGREENTRGTTNRDTACVSPAPGEKKKRTR